MSGSTDGAAAGGPLGVVLAGGLSRRMGGGDKCLALLDDRRLLDHALDRLRPQIRGAVAVNANGDPSRFERVDAPIVPDPIEGWLGPLAGVLAGLEWAADQGAEAIVTVAADTPFAPDDLVVRLAAAAQAEGTPLACAETGGRPHPTFGLWPTALADDLRRALVEDGVRKILHWTDRHGCARARFDDLIGATPGLGPDGDPFFNVNTPEDMAAARAAARTMRQAEAPG